MRNLRSSTHIDEDVILGDVLKILEDITPDWETEFAGEIGPETRLIADLGLDSSQLAMLAGDIEEHFNQRNLPFRKLLITADGRYVEDLRVSELVSFLSTHVHS
jgi:acyl carrier protein